MERKALVRQYMDLGLSRDACLKITGLSRHQWYHEMASTPPGRGVSTHTLWRDPADGQVYSRENREVMDQMVYWKLHPDYPNGYRLLSKALQLQGYYINHKKVFRLMVDYCLLEQARKRSGRNFVKFRRVNPKGPLSVLEMDIKYVGIAGTGRFAYILTILDTFTRYVLSWRVGYQMQQVQVKEAWQDLIVSYLQPLGIPLEGMEIELRNDNGKHFSAKSVQTYLEQNYVQQVFCHPYTPEENGHVESFHHTLGKALEKDTFASLAQAESRLKDFYTVYNNERPHGSLKGIPPAKFWALYESGKIRAVPLDKNKIRWKLEVPYQEILSQEGIHQYEYIPDRCPVETGEAKLVQNQVFPANLIL